MPIKFDNKEHSLSEQPFVWPRGGNILTDAGADLVRELARVGWDVPGIDVTFLTTGSGRNVFRTLYSISGETPEGPFLLSFNNPGDSRGTFWALNKLGRASIPPGLDLRYYNDNGTIIAELYLGGDWRRDGKAFINATKVNSKLLGKPRTYLKYKGNLSGDALEHDNDLGREYSPEGDDPVSLDVKGTTRQIADFIHERLIPILAKMPTAPGSEDINEFGDANLLRLAMVDPITAPGDFPVLYSWIDFNDGYRALGSSPSASADYIIKGNGYRLVALGDNPHGSKLHPRAHDGFSYASANPSVKASQVTHHVREDSIPVEIRLKHLNEIYVVDNAPYHKVRNEIGRLLETEGRDRFTKAELACMVTAVAATMVPATTYDGSFEQPTYLIGRQLRSDEARVMRGDIALHITEGRIHATLTDEDSGISMLIADYRSDDRCKVGLWAESSAIRIAERIASLVGSRVEVQRDHDLMETDRSFSA